jgi:two-component system LytT family response regulator
MTVRVVIVDDEPLARERIRDLVARHPDTEIAAECGDGIAAVAALDRLRPDAVLLDVQMPGLDGFDVIATAEHLPAVVFVTAYDEHALRAFDAHAVDYLLKPIDARRFDIALARLRERLSLPAADVRTLAADLGRYRGWSTRLAVRGASRIELVAVADIHWIEAAGNYVVLKLAAGEHLLRETLKSIEARLDPAAFARIHRSVIVNIDRISHLEPIAHGEYLVTMRDELLSDHAEPAYARRAQHPGRDARANRCGVSPGVVPRHARGARRSRWPAPGARTLDLPGAG